MEGQQLFLMEFLVDKVNIPAIRAIHEEILPARTCVSFRVNPRDSTKPVYGFVNSLILL